MQGSCLCGAVAFEVDGPIRDGIACHCTQCRKMSGHYWVASSVPMDRFRLIRDDDALRWYAASSLAERGFCQHCGAFLLWKPADEDRMSFALGAIDGATGVGIAEHIFGADAGDYYAPEGPPPPQGFGPTGPLHGSCHCGGVAFTVARRPDTIGACHCTQCRKVSGHYAASFEADDADLQFESVTTLAEYTAAGGARRGFCARCASGVFFRAPDGGLSIEAGVIDGPTGARLGSHIFVADKGDYYALDDGLPQHPRWD